MNTLMNDLKSKKDLKDTTVKNYIRSLKIANCGENFTSLAFLNKKAQVEECISKYKDGSKKSILTAICSVLKLRSNEKLYKHYFDKLMSYNQPPSNEKTETQKENWIEWEDVLKIKEQYALKNDTQENRLKSMVLSLYTEMQPRRVLDYICMYVVPKLKADLSTDKNYLALKENVFVFNKYKTDKKYGQQVIEIPTQLRASINKYLAKHPLRDQAIYPFLINMANEPFKGSNSITMMLNRIFKRKVSASMLRHIFLTQKYGDNLKERQNDSEVMGHSLAEQANYVKY